MEFSIDKNTFLNGLFKVQGIVDKKHTIPILSNVLLSIEDDHLVVFATDLEIGLKFIIKCEALKEGKITIPAKKLFEIVKEMPDEIITFKLKENLWIELKCKNSLFNLVGLSAEEYPKFPNINNDHCVINKNIIQEMIESTIYSVSNDETKFNLNGIYIKYENDSYLDFVSTDGHRLSLIKRKIDQNFTDKFHEGFILPKKGLFELKKIIENRNENIKLGICENIFYMLDDNITFFMRIIDGDFPDYKKVIPEKTDNFSQINKEEFLNVLRRVSVLSSDKSKGVKLSFKKNILSLHTSNPDLGDAKEELEIKYDGHEISIGFNAKYILDILNVIKNDKIIFYLKDNISPGMITPFENDDFLSVIMPMRL